MPIHRDGDLAARPLVRNESARLVGAAGHAGPAADATLEAGADDDLSAEAAVGAVGFVYGADLEYSLFMRTCPTPR